MCESRACDRCSRTLPPTAKWWEPTSQLNLVRSLNVVTRQPLTSLLRADVLFPAGMGGASGLPAAAPAAAAASLGRVSPVRQHRSPCRWYVNESEGLREMAHGMCGHDWLEGILRMHDFYVA